jgi:PAS domain S-box-containing protein
MTALGDGSAENGFTWAEEDIPLVLSILSKAHMTFWAGAGAERDFAIRLWNPGAERIYGHPRDAALGKSYIDLFVNPSEKARAIQDHERIVRTDEVYDWDWAADDLTKDGEVRTMLTHCFPVQDPEDGTWLLAEMGIDISDFNKASQQLRKLKEDEFEKRELTLAKGIGEIGQAVTQVGVEGTISLVTDQVFSAVTDAVPGVGRCTLWLRAGSGLTRFDDPRSIATLTVPFDEDAALQFVLKDGQAIISDPNQSSSVAGRFRLSERRGRKRTFALLPLRGIRSTEPLGVLAITLTKGSLSDGDRARLETLAAFTGPLLSVAQELQRIREDGARRLRAQTKQQIFRSVLHTVGGNVYELRGLLHGLGDVVHRDEIPLDVRDLLVKLRDRTEHLNTSLSDLRNHLESEDQHELVSVADAIAEVVNPLRINYLDVEFQIEADPDHTVFMVRGWLHHILHNLVTNAAQVLMQEYRGGHVLIRSVRSGEDRVEIHIEDTGPGVDSSIASTLFEKGVTRRDGGTGEGLHIALDLAVSSGGDITLSSKASPRLGGAHFRIDLPTRRDAA